MVSYAKLSCQGPCDREHHAMIKIGIFFLMDWGGGGHGDHRLASSSLLKSLSLQFFFLLFWFVFESFSLNLLVPVLPDCAR